MHAFSSSDVLELWDRGLALHPLDRALLALGAFLPEVTRTSLADWPLGRRNQALLQLHCRCFGSQLKGWSACAACAEKMTFEMVGEVMASSVANDESWEQGLVVNGQSFRVPSSRDLAQVAGEADYRSAAVRLVELCRTSDHQLAVSEKDVEEIGERMALADPLAEIRLTLRCPTCECESEETLDIAAFIWAEIAARARRLLWEVHNLASVYGWTQSEVLSLSPARRAHYLEMVQA